MRSGSRLCGVAIVLLSWLTPASAGDAIEAIPGKRYELHRAHGPWMVMVASFRFNWEWEDLQPEQQGPGPQEVADSLVLELRQRGIPAYTYVVRAGGEDDIATRDRLGRVRMGQHREMESIGVLAGNYPSINDPLAQRTLQWIKSYRAQCLETGVYYQESSRRPNPLARAFMTANPLRDPSEIRAANVDPLLLRLNADEPLTLLNNPAEYSVVVATFTGRTTMELQNSPTASMRVPQGGVALPTYTLDIAAQDAHDLAVALRRFDRVAAYVWHGEHESVVTVGEFRSPQDPGVQQTQLRYGGDQLRHAFAQANNARSLVPGSNMFVVGSNGQKLEPRPEDGQYYLPNNAGNRIWLLEEYPQVIRVPRAR